MSRKKKKQQPTCDPGFCEESQYIGDGDFMCFDDRFPKPEFVMEDWTPTEHYNRCGGRPAK